MCGALSFFSVLKPFRRGWGIVQTPWAPASRSSSDQTHAAHLGLAQRGQRQHFEQPELGALGRCKPVHEGGDPVDRHRGVVLDLVHLDAEAALDEVEPGRVRSRLAAACGDCMVEDDLDALAHVGRSRRLGVPNGPERLLDVVVADLDRRLRPQVPGVLGERVAPDASELCRVLPRRFKKRDLGLGDLSEGLAALATALALLLRVLVGGEGRQVNRRLLPGELAGDLRPAHTDGRAEAELDATAIELGGEDPGGGDAGLVDDEVEAELVAIDAAVPEGGGKGRRVGPCRAACLAFPVS